MRSALIVALRRCASSRDAGSRAGFPGAPPGGVLHSLRLRQGLAQPGDFLAERLDRAGLARPVVGFGEERLQAHRFRPQGRRGLCRAAEWTLLTKVETSCDRILIAGGANVEAEWEQGPAV